MKHPDWIMDKLRADFKRSDLNKDIANPPPSIKCALGHDVAARWMINGEMSYWQPPNPEKCGECEIQEQKAYYIDTLIERFRKVGIPEEHQEWSLGWAPAKEYGNVPNAGIPTDFRDVIVVDKHNQHAYKSCLGHQRHDWMLFSGPVGTGKTTFASALMMDMIERDRQRYSKPIWTTEAALFRNCDIAGATDYAERVKMLDKHIRCGLLVIDDLGASRRPLTDWQGGAMRDLFDARHSRKLPTLLTTNISKWEGLAKRYGEHVVSRIHSRCGTMNILGGPDRRMG